jgi:hypothetical protein
MDGAPLSPRKTSHNFCNSHLTNYLVSVVVNDVCFHHCVNPGCGSKHIESQPGTDRSFPGCFLTDVQSNPGLHAMEPAVTKGES